MEVLHIDFKMQALPLQNISNPPWSVRISEGFDWRSSLAFTSPFQGRWSAFSRQKVRSGHDLGSCSALAWRVQTRTRFSAFTPSPLSGAWENAPQEVSRAQLGAEALTFWRDVVVVSSSGPYQSVSVHRPKQVGRAFWLRTNSSVQLKMENVP